MMRAPQRPRFVRQPHFVPRGNAILTCMLAILAIVGCGPKTIEIEPLDLPEDQVTIGNMDWSDWALTLNRICRGDQVDYGVLLEDRSSLDRALARMAAAAARTDSDLRPTDPDVGAFYINCYNAMMIRSLLELAIGNDMPATVPAGIESRYCFRLGDTLVTPAEISGFLKMMGWPVRFALCDGRLEGPPLPPRPFLGDLLDAQLNEAVRRSIRSENVVCIDNGESKELRLWSGLFDLREELIRDYERRYHTTDATMLNVLLEWSDRDRREVLNSAVGYAVTRMPSSGRPNAVNVAEPDKGVFSELRGFRLIRPN